MSIGGDDLSPAGALFVPPKVEDVPALVDDLVGFLGRSDLPAVVKAAIAHAQFETIHPFADDNGRTGRALVTGRAGTPDGALVDALLAQPVMDVAFAADAAGCSVTAARRSLERLEKSGIVIGYQAGKRRRAWRAPDVLDLMDRVATGLGRRNRAPGG